MHWLCAGKEAARLALPRGLAKDVVFRAVASEDKYRSAFCIRASQSKRTVKFVMGQSSSLWDVAARI